MMVDSNGTTKCPQASSSTQPISQTEPKKITSSVHDVNAEKPPFGSRFLSADSDVWSKNAWDHVPAPEDQNDRIASALARQQAMPVPLGDRPKYNDKPAKHWDNFYKMNNENFFRDRKWLHTEFPELVAATQPNAGTTIIAELGCGAGNSVFPLLTSNRNPELELYAFDYSHHAVKLVQRNELYKDPPIGSIHAAVWDLTAKDGPPDVIQPSSVDVVVLVFVLSALHPSEWSQAIVNIHKMLKPGGMVVMRDYGRHDMTQLRFKEGRLLDENLYIRGDKTRVYFFDLDDLSMLFTGAAAKPEDKEQLSILPPEPVVNGAEDEEAEAEGPVTPDFDISILPPAGRHPSKVTSEMQAKGEAFTAFFEKVQLGVDRRLLVNRKRQLKMYRVWVQAKFRKLA